MASDNAEVSGRANIQEPVRDLAESTGGFLIGDSNDLRVPLRHVNEEISSYYEVFFNPGIQNYDGSFRKIAVNANRKDLVIHARNGYFALPPEARASGMKPFEVPLLKVLSDAKVSEDVKFRAGAILLQPEGGRDARGGAGGGAAARIAAQSPGRAKAALDVHCSLVALVKDAKGEVVQKLTRDRGFQVTAEQLKVGNFVDKMTVSTAAGKVQPGKRRDGSRERQDRDAAIGIHGAGESAGRRRSLRSRRCAPTRRTQKGSTPNEPFQFQGGSVTPTMDLTVKKGPNAVLRLFFTVYQDASISAAPAVEIEFLQAGKSPHKSSDATAAPRTRRAGFRTS